MCLCLCVCERESDVPLSLCFLCIAVYKCLCTSVFTKEPKLRQLSVFRCVCVDEVKKVESVCVCVSIVACCLKDRTLTVCNMK